MSAPAVLGGTAIRPVERHGMEACRYFCYDPDKGTVMGRTGKSWLLITIFYIIYYVCLIAFWLLMMNIFLLTISDDHPKWQGEESVIGTSPGLGMRPKQPDATIDSSMILWNKDAKMDDGPVLGWEFWKVSTAKFLSKYDPKSRQSGEMKNCTFNDPVETEPDKDGNAARACIFDASKKTLGDCATPPYGYNQGRPCVFLKLNRLFGVQNDHYTGSGNKTFPKEMPLDLQRHIARQPNKDMVWIQCQGQNPADEESLGPMKYYPNHQGLPGFYFPYMKQPHYESPIVAVQFMKPALGQLLHVECKAWAGNIKHNRADKLGMVRFEIMMLNNELAVEYKKSF